MAEDFGIDVSAALLSVTQPLHDQYPAAFGKDEALAILVKGREAFSGRSL
jgi:hypothetical protein